MSIMRHEERFDCLWDQVQLEGNPEDYLVCGMPAVPGRENRIPSELTAEQNHCYVSNSVGTGVYAVRRGPKNIQRAFDLTLSVGIPAAVAHAAFDRNILGHNSKVLSEQEGVPKNEPLMIYNAERYSDETKTLTVPVHHAAFDLLPHRALALAVVSRQNFKQVSQEEWCSQPGVARVPILGRVILPFSDVKYWGLGPSYFYPQDLIALSPSRTMLHAADMAAGKMAGLEYADTGRLTGRPQ